VRPADAQRVRTILPAAELLTLTGFGNLAHEEQPRQIAALSRSIAERHGVLPGAGRA